MSGDGMEGLVTALTGTGGINSATMWTEATSAAPLIISIFVFAFGYGIVRKLLRSGAKGKVRI